MKRTILVLIALFVCYIFLLEWVDSSPSSEQQTFYRLWDLLNREGWALSDLPLSENELLNKRVEEMLNFDNYRFVECTKGGVSLTIFILQWGKGKSGVIETSTHVPDNCFVANGMIMSRKDTIVEEEQMVLNWREFESGDDLLNVTYIHRAGDDYITYRSYTNGRTFKFLFDNFWSLFSFEKRNQVFVRIVEKVSTKSKEDRHSDEILSFIKKEIMAYSVQ